MCSSVWSKLFGISYHGILSNIGVFSVADKSYKFAHNFSILFEKCPWKNSNLVKLQASNMLKNELNPIVFQGILVKSSEHLFTASWLLLESLVKFSNNSWYLEILYQGTPFSGDIKLYF